MIASVDCACLRCEVQCYKQTRTEGCGMVISLADFYGIDPQLFNKTGALDPILGVDTRLFIDPRLLVDTTVPELANSAGKIAAHFDDVIRLLLNVQQEGDPFWRRADRFLSFPEVRGLCIGYSSESTAGRGMGPKSGPSCWI